MNSRLKLVPILLVSFVLALGVVPSAEADAIYSLNEPAFGVFSWSFEVPAIITTDTTITSFLSTNIVPGGQAANQGCTTIDSVSIFSPDVSLPFVASVKTICGPTNFSLSDGFIGPITGFGTFMSFGGGTLTISPSGVPEPSSLLLLAGGLTVLLAWRRKRIG